MSLRNAPLFSPDGLGLPLLFAQLRRRMPVRPVQSRAVLVDDGRATKYFADWWRVAYPSRGHMPTDPIAEKDGRGTTRFWDALDS